MMRWPPPIRSMKLVESPEDPDRPIHFEAPCFGLCTETVHVFVYLLGGTRVRHGEGEAARMFTREEWDRLDFLEWIAAVHRHEVGR